MKIQPFRLLKICLFLQSYDVTRFINRLLQHKQMYVCMYDALYDDAMMMQCMNMYVYDFVRLSTGSLVRSDLAKFRILKRD